MNAEVEAKAEISARNRKHNEDWDLFTERLEEIASEISQAEQEAAYWRKQADDLNSDATYQQELAEEADKQYDYWIDNGMQSS